LVSLKSEDKCGKSLQNYALTQSVAFIAAVSMTVTNKEWQ